MPAEGDELAGLSLDELSKRGSSLLVEVDDAVKTSEQEVAFATAQFGDEAAAPFAAAVESAKVDLAKAFQLRRALDDSTKEDDAQRRAMLTEIITLTQGGERPARRRGRALRRAARDGAERAGAPRGSRHPPRRARDAGAGRRSDPRRADGDVCA